MFSNIFKGDKAGHPFRGNQWSTTNHGMMRFRSTDHNGNTKQLSIGVNSSGNGFVELHGVDSTGKVKAAHSLSSVASHTSGLNGTAAREQAVRSALTTSYAGSGGSASKVLSSLNKVSGGIWSSHEHIKPTKKGDVLLGEVFKGAPMGNKNASGKHSAAAQAASSASDKAKASGSKKDHLAAFDAQKKASIAANQAGDKKNATLHSKAAQTHFASSKIAKEEDYSGMLGTQAQHGLAQKKEAPAVGFPAARPVQKNERPTSGWAGDLGVGCLRK